MEPALDGTILPKPDVACFSGAVDQLETPDRATISEFADDAAVWSELSPNTRFGLVSAYLGCTDLDETVTALAVVLTGAVPQVACLSEGWRGVLTSEAIASSVAFGEGLDDLPSDVVDTLTSAVMECVPDEEWWIENMAQLFDRAVAFDLSLTESRCVARAYVSTLGLSEAIRRRVLTIPMLAISPQQLRDLDLLTTCGRDISLPPSGLEALAGDCVASLATELETVVPCSDVHDAEVISVRDVSTMVRDWPGIVALQQLSQKSCVADVEAALPSLGQFESIWEFPSRIAWERGGRQLSCMIRRTDGAPWSGPSGAVIETPTTATTTTSTTSTPSTPGTLVDINAVAVGQCLRGAQLIDGDIGDGLVEVVDCSTPHHAEVFHVSFMEGPAGTPYPGDEFAKNTALSQCHPAFDAYVGRVWGESRLGFTYVYPYDFEWDANNRLVLCYLWDRLGRPLTSSMAGSGQ